MFKLVVLFSAMCALAACEPSGALFTAPLAAPFTTTFFAPLTHGPTFYSPATTFTKTGTVLQSAPLISGPHFIKKRSAIAPLAYSPAVITPAAYSTQSRIDFPAKTIYTAAADPIISTPLTYASHF